MTDETSTPVEPVGPTSDAGEAPEQPTPSVAPDSAPAQAGQPESALERIARLERTNLRLASENNALRAQLDEALNVHKPEPFPCALYRGSETTQANGPAELSRLLSQGWRETKG